MKFKIHSKFKPSGDQPQAIDKLVEGIEEGKKNYFRKTPLSTLFLIMIKIKKR